MPFMRKYGDGTNGWVKIPVPKSGFNDFATGSDWTPATGDVKISIDDGAQANITTLPTFSNGGWKFTFSNAELQGKEIHVAVVDAATKAVDDQYFIIETYGHASAKYVNDLSTNVPNTTAPNTVAPDNTSITRILALLGDNQVLDDTTYDGSGNLTAGTLYCYDTKAHAQTHNKSTGLIASYSIANTISTGNATLSKQLRES